MKKHLTLKLTGCLAGLIACGILWQARAAEGGDDATKKFMKSLHKAPKGVDPVCKKAQEGRATADELARLVDGYKAMTTVKAPKGDDASWKEKTAKVFAAAQSLQKGEAGAAAKYKEASNCKACHSAHKPD